MYFLCSVARTQHSGRLTCGPTKLMGTEGFVNLVNMNDSSSINRTMSIQRPLCFFNLYSSCCSCSNKRRRDCLLPPPRDRLCCCTGLTAPPYSHRWPSHTSTHPHGHTCCYSPARADEPVNPRTVVLPSAWETTVESSLPPCRSLPRPRCRAPP